MAGLDTPDLEQLFDMTGKVALVTGGSRGLGKEMVKAFAARGADVVITSRKFEACEELAAEIRDATGRRALAYGCHVGRWDEIEGLVDAAYNEFGRVDVLVNNAGLSPTYADILDVNEKLFDSVNNINFKGPFRLCALVGSRMFAGDGGVIINVSSTGSIRNHPTIIPYAASKSALNSLTEGFAHYFAPKVRVNTLMSGPFLTDMSKGWDMEANLAAQKQSAALQRFAEPHEVVGTALFLATNASSYTSGVAVRVDGGIY